MGNENSSLICGSFTYMDHNPYALLITNKIDKGSKILDVRWIYGLDGHRLKRS